MVMNSGVLSTLTVCVTEGQADTAADQFREGPVVDVEQGGQEEFNSAMDASPHAGSVSGEHLGRCDAYPAGSGSESATTLPPPSNDPISQSRPVGCADTCGAPETTGDGQTLRLGDLDLDTLVSILSNEAFQSADPEMQKAALAAALNHQDPNMALNALLELVQSDLFQGQGLGDALSAQDMGAVRSMLLGVFGSFANAQSGQGRDDPASPGMGASVPVAPSQGVPAQSGAGDVNNPTPVGNGSGHGVRGSETGQGCTNHEQSGMSSVPDVVASNDANSEDSSAQSPATREDNNFGELAQVLQMLLRKLMQSDAENGSTSAQAFLDMFKDTLADIATNLGGEGAADIVNALSNMPLAGTSTDSASTAAQQPIVLDRPAPADHQNTQQAFIKAFSEVL